MQPSAGELVRAAAYLRMSTESQNYSTGHQEAAIAAYAMARGFIIVRTYTDGGVSGLTLKRREGLKRLLADVIGGTADFTAILIYDVSRWGRFQDADESAHYEFLCRQAGVQVEYCAEAFDNDGSMVATLLKNLKRAMAAEKSRDLSATVTRAKRRMGLKGYWPGGNPPFGLRRASEADARGDVTILEPGQRNGLKGRRIRVAAGPEGEVELVRDVFRRFTTRRTTPNAIARWLNTTRPNSHRGKPWTQVRVRKLLQNELYVGVRVVGRARVELGEWRRQPASEWISVPDACAPVVAPRVFKAAQRRLQRRPLLSDEELIERLQALCARQGRLSHSIIARDRDTPSPSTYRARFGSLAATYARAGYTPTREQARTTAQLATNRGRGLRPASSSLTDEEVIARLQALRETAGILSMELIEITPGLPRIRNLLRRFGSMAHVYELAGHLPTDRQCERLGKKLDRHCAGTGQA